LGMIWTYSITNGHRFRPRLLLNYSELPTDNALENNGMNMCQEGDWMSFIDFGSITGDVLNIYGGRFFLCGQLYRLWKICTDKAAHTQKKKRNRAPNGKLDYQVKLKAMIYFY
jgi:hypothetical protein